MDTILIILFGIGTMPFVLVSWKSLRHVSSHGFYRFFAWEILLGLLLLNIRGWFQNPFAWYQLISWILLIGSLVLVIQAVRLLREIGKSNTSRSDPALLGLEKTSRLVMVGLYRYIRHPMYSSLLFLAWGIFFKSPSWLDGGLALLCTIFLIVTARVEEQEDICFFGEEYVSYKKQTKMFIPFIF
jgi:protein-S-isoprenylcysteine O-methyltransferase Ste14